MAKLYPPYLEGTIPAFYTENIEGTDETILTVPFSMNRSVGKVNVGGFSLKMKTVNSNVFVYTNLKATAASDYDIEDKYFVQFNLGSASKLRVGSYYKIQLAYIDVYGEIGYYSTVGIVKYTTKPTIKIESLSQRAISASRMTYYGTYSQEGKDTSEKEYSFNFTIYNSAGEKVLDSGEIVHNTENDEETYRSQDEYSFPDVLEKNVVYSIQYTVTTVNKMVVKSHKYRIVNKLTLAPEIEANLNAVLNYDNGYIEVNLKGTMFTDGGEKSATGAFLITRSCSDTNFTVWNEVMKFQLHGQLPSRKLLRDYTIEQGKEYQYALQQYSDYGLYSEKMVSNVIMSDFEDAFLYDGERQLKIKYNPKVTSFKIDRPESKLDTIGSKYPFFFRNGRVEYKEFPISGLISYLGDEQELFLTNEELNLADIDLQRHSTIRDISDLDLQDMEERGDYADYSYLEEALRLKKQNLKAIDESHIRTTNYLDYSIAAERKFKMTVLDWLTNGKPKLFRSPGEGNYVVRLMNVSLSPEDKTSRVIHSFSATAYEIAPCDYTSLVDYELIDTTEQNIIQLRWETIPLSTTDDKSLDDRYVLNGEVFYAQGSLIASHRVARTVTFSDMQPGDIVYILTEDNFYRNTTFNINTDRYELNNEVNCPGKIVIGATGSYTLDLDINIKYIGVPSNAHYNGLITYSYYNDAQNVFNTIVDINPTAQLGRQYIGSHQTNILDSILNIKNLACTFLYLHFSKRDVGKAYYYQSKWYRDANHELELNADPMLPSNEHPRYLYQDTGYYADPFMLYKYEVDSFNVYLSDRRNPVKLVGIQKVDNEEVANTLINILGPNNEFIPQVYEGYYYLDDSNNLINAGGTTYLEDRIYYIKKPFIFYYDPFHEAKPDDQAYRRTEELIIDPESYDVAVTYAKEVLGATKDVSLQNVQLYSNEAVINNYPIDLTEIEKYNIDFRYDYQNLQIANGVVLECGYETQTVNYTVETTPTILSSPNYQMYAELYNTTSLESFDEFLENRNPNYKLYYSSIQATDFADDMNYAQTIANARNNYDIVYSNYIDYLTIQQKLWEEAHNYDEQQSTT